VVNQKGTFFWHAHVSWLRGTVHGAMIVYPKNRVPFPFKAPYQEQIIILGNLKVVSWFEFSVSNCMFSLYNTDVAS